jgi:hypothetical protein
MLDETDIPTQKAQINLILQQKKDKVFSCGFDVEISKEGIRQAIKELNGY